MIFEAILLKLQAPSGLLLTRAANAGFEHPRLRGRCDEGILGALAPWHLCHALLGGHLGPGLVGSRVLFTHLLLVTTLVATFFLVSTSWATNLSGRDLHTALVAFPSYSSSANMHALLFLNGSCLLFLMLIITRAAFVCSFSSVCWLD